MDLTSIALWGDVCAAVCLREPLLRVCAVCISFECPTLRMSVCEGFVCVRGVRGRPLFKRRFHSHSSPLHSFHEDMTSLRETLAHCLRPFFQSAGEQPGQTDRQTDRRTVEQLLLTSARHSPTPTHGWLFNPRERERERERKRRGPSCLHDYRVHLTG